MAVDHLGDSSHGNGRWIQKATRRMEQKGTVGSFTRQAKKAGYSSPKAYADHVMAHKKEYPAQTVKRANFAKNV